MPNVDGVELLTAIRKKHSVVPVIAMSGGIGGDMVGMFRAPRLLGARCALAKPFPCINSLRLCAKRYLSFEMISAEPQN